MAPVIFRIFHHLEHRSTDAEAAKVTGNMQTNAEHLFTAKGIEVNDLYKGVSKECKAAMQAQIDDRGTEKTVADVDFKSREECPHRECGVRMVFEYRGNVRESTGTACIPNECRDKEDLQNFADNHRRMTMEHLNWGGFPRRTPEEQRKAPHMTSEFDCSQAGGAKVISGDLKYLNPNHRNEAHATKVRGGASARWDRAAMVFITSFLAHVIWH